jgi:hypothetical protein
MQKYTSLLLMEPATGLGQLIASVRLLPLVAPKARASPVMQRLNFSMIKPLRGNFT